MSGEAEQEHPGKLAASMTSTPKSAAVACWSFFARWSITRQSPSPEVFVPYFFGSSAGFAGAASFAAAPAAAPLPLVLVFRLPK